MKHITGVAGVNERSGVLARDSCGIGAGGGAAPSVLQSFCGGVCLQSAKSRCAQQFPGCSEQAEAVR